MSNERITIGGHDIQMMMLGDEPYLMMVSDKRISLDNLEMLHDTMKDYAERMTAEPEEEEEVELDADGNPK